MERYSYPAEQRAALEQLRQPFAVYQFIDKRVVTLLVSDGFCERFGYTKREEAVYDMDHNMYELVHPDDLARISDAAVRFATEGGTYEAVYRTRTKISEGYRVIHAIGEHVTTETGARLSHVWYTDEGPYTEGEPAAGNAIRYTLATALREESILKESRYDSLTGLPNLNYFFELAEAFSTSMREDGGNAALLYMDLDGMKDYNDRNGFKEGDKLLQAFAKALAQTFSHESCCHIGADRFTVCAREDGLENVLDRFFRDAAKINDGKMLPVRVGIYTAGRENVPVSSAYDRTKMACDTLRKSGTSSYAMYSEELRDSIRRRQYIQANIDRAISEGWIQVHYQAIVRAVNSRVCDEEALARWIDPTEGLLSPAEFIPYLEEAGLIYKLDLYVLEQVLAKMKHQEEAGLYVVPHSINLSRSDFDSCDIVEEIRKRVDRAGIAHRKVTIELTESLIGSDFGFISRQVERFRQLSFPVWMDDFGSGYSSLDVLQSIQFDLIKFDMSFMRKLDEGENGKIILTELMRMATSLGVDTVCEGVETEAQVRFLQEIGCSKLQGFYFSKPISFEEIVENHRKGMQIDYEDPRTSGYYETIGRVNLYDLSVISGEEGSNFQNAFNTLPMGLIEIRDDKARFSRSNQSYRDFIKRFFNVDLSASEPEFAKFEIAFMRNIVTKCCEQGNRAFFDEKMPDGSVVHSFTRRISTNPVTGGSAVVVTVLSVSAPDESESYEDITRALAADYYNIYVVDTDTGNYIAYTSQEDMQEPVKVHRGEDYFATAKEVVKRRVYTEDLESFSAIFTKENILKELNEHGVYMITCRTVETGIPMYTSVKIMRMSGTNRIIIGISDIDSQMKEQEQTERIRKERNVLSRVIALSEDYLMLYSADPVSGKYTVFTTSDDAENLGTITEGEDFFRDGAADASKVIHPEDLPGFLKEFTRENILAAIREKGWFTLIYRLLLHGREKKVVLKIVPYRDGEEEKLIASVRVWRERR